VSGGFVFSHNSSAVTAEVYWSQPYATEDGTSGWEVAVKHTGTSGNLQVHVPAICANATP
jgi:hypothetical protein